MVAQAISKVLARQRTELVGSAWNVFRTLSTVVLSILGGPLLFLSWTDPSYKKFLMPLQKGNAGGWWYMALKKVFSSKFGDRLRFIEPDNTPSFLVDTSHYSIFTKIRK